MPFGTIRSLLARLRALGAGTVAPPADPPTDRPEPDPLDDTTPVEVPIPDGCCALEDHEPHAKIAPEGFDDRLKIDEDGWLVGPNVTHYPSRRRGKLESGCPIASFWHSTGMFPGVSDDDLSRSIQTYTAGKDRAASWHFLIGMDGHLYQSVSLDAASWHIGRPGKILGRSFANVNAAGPGIELRNEGRLKKIDGDWYAWGPEIKGRRPSGWVKDPSYRILPERAVRSSSGGVWAAFPEEQIAGAKRLVQAFLESYDWPREAFELYHGLYVTTKEDPGLLWMRDILPDLLDEVFGSRR